MIAQCRCGDIAHLMTRYFKRKDFAASDEPECIKCMSCGNTVAGRDSVAIQKWNAQEYDDV